MVLDVATQLCVSMASFRNPATSCRQWACALSPCSPVLLGQSAVPVRAGQAEGAEVTWRSLYACGNGWRGLRPGCFEQLDLPLGSEEGVWGQGYPPHCILDGRDLGWAAAAGAVSELLVVADWTSVQVPPHASAPKRLLRTHTHAPG